MSVKSIILFIPAFFFWLKYTSAQNTITIDHLTMINPAEDWSRFATKDDEIILVFGYITIDKNDSIISNDYSINGKYIFDDSIKSLSNFPSISIKISHQKYYFFYTLIETDTDHHIDLYRQIFDNLPTHKLEEAKLFIPKKMKTYFRDDDILGIGFFPIKVKNKAKNHCIDVEGNHLLDAYHYQLCYTVSP